MILVTIDSNVVNVPVAVAWLLPNHASAWCTTDDACVCNNVPSTAGDDAAIALYDTPLAMCPDYSPPPGDGVRVVSFVYIDGNADNHSYRRLLDNLRRTVGAADRVTTVVVLSDSAVPARGTYTVVLEEHNCGVDMVAKLLALMVNAFLHDRRFYHPEALLDLARRRPNPSRRTLDVGVPVRCDLYTFSKRNCHHQYRSPSPPSSSPPIPLTTTRSPPNLQTPS